MKQRIIDYVSANEPVKRTVLHVITGLSLRALDREIRALKNCGQLYSMPGFGYFSSEASCGKWLKGIGMEQLRIRASHGAAASVASRKASGETWGARIIATLATEGSLGASQIAAVIGVPYRQISSAVSTLVNNGELKHRGPAGARVYSLATRNKKIRPPSSVNVIFQECRQSPAMQRVLAVYGRASA